MGLALLSHSNLAIKYCEDAFLTATYIINRLPTKILQTKTHFEMVYQKPPYYGFFTCFWLCLLAQFTSALLERLRD